MSSPGEPESPGRILVVDDDPEAAAYVLHVLRNRRGFEVMGAGVVATVSLVILIRLFFLGKAPVCRSHAALMHEGAPAGHSGRRAAPVSGRAGGFAGPGPGRRTVTTF